jgi:hypothetical protein
VLVDQQLSFMGAQGARQGVQQCGLAGPGGANHRHLFTWGDVQMKWLEGWGRTDGGRRITGGAVFEQYLHIK